MSAPTLPRTGHRATRSTPCPPRRTTLPPHDEMQPISETQFAALVHGYEARDTDRGTTYARNDHPWLFTRCGPYVAVTHRAMPDARRYYEIV